ncbi:MAG: hypothetical protein JKX84_08290 [Flavobacteriales bacterium]|nr:hypothetical protein [Flavobacteriales bacterium]
MEEISENDKLEYQEAMKFRLVDSGFRRQGLTFVASIQVVLITIIANSGVNPWLSISLATIGMTSAILGLNNDFRLSKYMDVCEQRSIEIEKKNELKLCQELKKVEHNRTRFLSNKTVFRTFFLLIAVGWIVFLAWTIYSF